MNDRLKHVLFEDENKTLINIKFCKGRDDVTEKELRDAAAEAVFRIDNQLLPERDWFGDGDRHQVDVVELATRIAS